MSCSQSWHISVQGSNKYTTTGLGGGTAPLFEEEGDGRSTRQSGGQNTQGGEVEAPIRSPRSHVQGSRLGPSRQIVGKAPNASFRVGQTRPQAEEDPTSMSVLAKPHLSHAEHSVHVFPEIAVDPFPLFGVSDWSWLLYRHEFSD